MSKGFNDWLAKFERQTAIADAEFAQFERQTAIRRAEFEERQQAYADWDRLIAETKAELAARGLEDELQRQTAIFNAKYPQLAEFTKFY